MRLILFLVATTSVVSAQRLYFGVVGGTSVTSSFPGFDQSAPADAFGNPASRFQYLSGPRSLILGGLLEGRLSERWSIEANVLSRPLKAVILYTEFSGSAITYSSRDTFSAVRAWEFPVLVKYTLPAIRSSRVRPFIAAGPSFRTQENAGPVEPSQFGVTAGLGASLHFGRIRVSPAWRYTRWQQESVYPKYPTKPDQLEFLTSIAYETDAETRRLGGVPIRIGAIAGLSLAPGFHSGDQTGDVIERTRYLAGLTAEVSIANHLAIEVDAIYKPLRAGSDTPDVQTPFSVLTWQFPVLAKYRWTRPRWTPFAEAGPSFRLSGNLNGYDPALFGLTVGGGVEKKAGGFRFAPGLRYTRWIGERTSIRTPSGFVYHPATTNANSVELVFGVSF